MALASTPRRLQTVMLAVAIAMSLCAGRLVQLQGFDSAAYAASSTDQLTRTLPLLPSRGDITDRNGVVLAATEAAVAVIADPSLTRYKPFQFAAILSRHLQMDEPTLLRLLTKPNTRFTYIKKKVPALTYSAMAKELADNQLRGIFRESDPVRTYPAGSVAASVVGFVGADGKGLGGLERKLNTQLAGVEGKESYTSAPNGSKIPLGPSLITPAQNGLGYQLTLDAELQWAAERRLAEQVRRTRADSGIAVMMNIKTGEVLAMANAPTFDARRPGAAKPQDRGNRAVSDPYEPGSVQKVLTAAALVDSGTATAESKVTIPQRLPSGGRSIKDHFPHGTIRFNLRGVVAHSSNIGAVKFARQMDVAVLRDYLKRFGLGARTGIDIPGESTGVLPPADMKGYTRDQLAFGQGLSVTAIQEIAAIAGILNNGVYHPPTVIKGATGSDGLPVKIDRAPSRQVVSPETSKVVQDLMRAVVDSENGQRNLTIPAYQTGGKTGTAQRANSKCKCYRGYVTSYVGFAPADDPSLLTYVVLDNPRKQTSGTGSAAPVFKDLMELALPRYGVPPTTRYIKPKPVK